MTDLEKQMDLLITAFVRQFTGNPFWEHSSVWRAAMDIDEMRGGTLKAEYLDRKKAEKKG